MSADGGGRLFVYGTLLFAAVREAVCGRALGGRAATLAVHARHALRGEVYPAVVPRAGASTAGQVLEGIDDALWRVLDDWESPLYERRTVAVRVAGGELLTAQVYLLAPSCRDRLDTAPWDPETFADRHLAAYLARWGEAS